jgi:hypothetical protein
MVSFSLNRDNASDRFRPWLSLALGNPTDRA